MVSPDGLFPIKCTYKFGCVNNILIYEPISLAPSRVHSLRGRDVAMTAPVHTCLDLSSVEFEYPVLNETTLNTHTTSYIMCLLNICFRTHSFQHSFQDTEIISIKTLLSC